MCLPECAHHLIAMPNQVESLPPNQNRRLIRSQWRINAGKHPAF